MIGNGQVRPDPAKLRAVEQYPTPTTKQKSGTYGILSQVHWRLCKISSSLDGTDKEAQYRLE